MKRASQFFNKEDLRKIADAVEDAERRTSGEIVPAVAGVSGRYDRAEDLFGMVLALVVLTLSWLWVQEIQPVEGDWEMGQTLVLGLVPILFIVLAGFLIGAVAATRIPVLRLPFISKKEMLQEVERGAAEAFHRFRVRRTAEASGILIYVSLYEHMVRVIGDDAINEKLGQSDWDGVRDLVIDGIRSGQPADGLVRAIRKCGELLSEHFPVRPGDVNELHNELRIID